MIRSAGALLAAVGLLAGCAPAALPPAGTPPDLADQLAGRVGVEAMLAHLRQLQDIAVANGGSRADGTPGFDASVQYVAKTLRDNGFEVETPEFSRLDTTSPGRPTLFAGAAQYPVDQASLLVRTPPGGVTGQVIRPANPAGCEVDDYPPSTPGRAIAVVDDAGCSVVDKQNAASAQGAAALIVVSRPGRSGPPPALFPPGYYDKLTLPVAIADPAADAALRGAAKAVKLILDTVTVKTTSRNVLAQTRTGSEHDVVVVGAHLDSAAAGPGINDDGSGVAAVLETAVQLGSSPTVANAVRFAFWGGQAQQVGGASDYVFSLDRDGLNDIALYLDFDMLGSLNAGFFTYDGDQSASPSRDVEPEDVPAGSAGIERTLAGYLNLAGKRPADMPLSGGTDYTPFLFAGVPVGGMTTGASQQKTPAQARLWGGRAGAAFDPNYRGARDDIDNINRDALAVTGSGVAFAVGGYAQSIAGVNGVPPHDKRHRAPLGP